MVGLSGALPGIRMVGFLEAPRYSYGWTLRGPPVFVWMESWRPPGFRIVGLLEALPIFEWMDS